MRPLASVLVAVALGSIARAEPPLPPEYRYKEPQYALGVRVRGLWVTQAMLSSFLAASTNMQNASLAAEFIYRKRAYDVVTSLDFSFVSPDDGNYLSRDRKSVV